MSLLSFEKVSPRNTSLFNEFFLTNCIISITIRVSVKVMAWCHHYRTMCIYVKIVTISPSFVILFFIAKH